MRRKKYITINENIKAGFGSGNFLSNILLFSVLLEAIFKLIEHYAENINKVLFNILDLSTILLAFIFAVVNFFLSYKNNKDKSDFDIKIDKSIIKKVVAAPIDPLYKESGYEWYNVGDNYALSSYKVNKDILSFQDNYFFVNSKGKQKLNERQKRILLKLYNDKRKSKVLLFNDPHIGLRTDILLSNNKDKVLKVIKTNYYAHITSNQLIYKRIFVDDSTLFYDGWRMTLNEDYSYKNFNVSRAANMFGTSSLVVSKDGYLIITRQGRKNDSGVNELIPTSSGSIDYDDMKLCRTRGKGKSKQYYLKDLVINTAIRETKEEANIDKENIYRAEVIGFMRMLFLGGHPEFMTLLYSDLSKDEIVKNFIFEENEKERLIRSTTGNELEGLYTNIKLEDIFNSDIDKLLKEKLPNETISIQLYMILTMLHKHHEEGMI